MLVARRPVSNWMFSDGEPFFPARSGKKTCATIGQNFVFLRGFSENSFASLINRAPPSPRLRRTRRARRRARARMAIKPYLVLDGRIDCEKTGGPTKQVERRARTKS